MVPIFTITKLRLFGSVQNYKFLRDKVALITGGADGIGLEIARIFLKNEICGLTIVDINKDKGISAFEELCKEFNEKKFLCVEGDVSKPKHLDWIFKKTLEKFKTLNIVINNAGVMNDVKWENQVSTNISSCIVGTLLGMQYMSKTCSGKGGTIINMASTMGLCPSFGFPIHTLTQFGIVGFSRAIGGGEHFRRTGVKVLAVCPGLTNTQLIKQAPYHAINAKFANEFKEETADQSIQSPVCVAQGVLELLDCSNSGSVWVVENGDNVYEVLFPDFREDTDVREEREEVSCEKTAHK